MTGDTSPPRDISDRLFKNLMEAYVLPAVRLRQERGDLPKPLNLRAAQILWCPDGRPMQVRVNAEVKGVADIRLKEGVRKKKGEPILETEIEAVPALKLPDEDGDCGHATIFRLPGRWSIVFDFSYNRVAGRRHTDAAREFLACKRVSYGRSTSRPR